MFAKILALLKSPLFWVVAVILIILAFAFSRFLKPLKQAAAFVPGSDAKTGAAA